jgi:heat shock protein HslJ
MKRVSLGSRLGAMLSSVLIVTALAACASAGGSGHSSSSSQGITGNWRLVSGADAKGAFTTGSAVVTFTLDGQSSGGRGPCNSFGATTTGATTGAISVVVGIHTDMACMDPELNATEARYFAALDKVTTAALERGTLTLTGNGDSLVFTRATT